MDHGQNMRDFNLVIPLVSIFPKSSREHARLLLCQPLVFPVACQSMVSEAFPGDFRKAVVPASVTQEPGGRNRTRNNSYAPCGLIRDPVVSG